MADDPTISGINLLQLAARPAKQKYRFHPKHKHTHFLTFTLACTLPLAVIITLRPLSDSVYWLSGQGLGVLSPITAVRAERDSINVKLVNSRGGLWLFLLLSGRKMSTDFKMSFVVAGQIKWTSIHFGRKETTCLIEEVRAAPGCLAAVNKTPCIFVCSVEWMKINKHKHLFRPSPARNSFTSSSTL